MSLSSGKASGKTITLTAYLDWFEDATGINDSDPKEWHELRERIADLEAELADADAQYDMCMRRAEKAEAEVERLKADNKRNVERVIYYSKKAGLYYEGGGRESGGEGVGDPASQVAAAANPAARKERASSD